MRKLLRILPGVTLLEQTTIIVIFSGQLSGHSCIRVSRFETKKICFRPISSIELVRTGHEERKTTDLCCHSDRGSTWSYCWFVELSWSSRRGPRASRSSARRLWRFASSPSCYSTHTASRGEEIQRGNLLTVGGRLKIMIRSKIQSEVRYLINRYSFMTS